MLSKGMKRLSPSRRTWPSCVVHTVSLRDERWPENAQMGKFIGVWRRRDGDWRLQFNMSNA
jgi:hypothetical protein